MMKILTRRVRPVLRAIVLEKFEEAKSWLLEAVANHSISHDISSHSASPRLSGSASGTLYGFIGFDANSQPDPVGDLVQFLDDEINFEERPAMVGKLFSSSVKYPSKQAFNIEEFVIPWEGKPWPLMIEDGISGLQHYINIGSPNSRSQEGIQVQKNIRSADFSGEPYLTPIFEQFRKKLLLGS